MRAHKTHNNILLASLLWVVMLFACPVSMWADTWDGTTTTKPSGSGTEADPYLIQSAADLAYFGSKYPNNSAWWKLTTDVDLNNQTWSYGQNKSAFKGHFDGAGHTVSNINIPVTSTGSYGFFSIVEGTSAPDRAEVKNLTLSNVSITSENDLSSGTNIGGLAGRLKYAVVTNVRVQGGTVTVSGSKNANICIGNMAGTTSDLSADEANVDFSGCYSENVAVVLNGNVLSSGNVYASNFFGYPSHNTNISDCHVVNSTITTTSGGTIVQDKSFCVGGLIGAVNNLKSLGKTGDITNCSITGQIIDLPSYGPANPSNFYKNNLAVGGAIGRVWQPYKLPHTIYFSGTINAPKATVGPVVGIIMKGRDATTFVYDDYSGENIQYISTTDMDAAFGTWSYGNYQLGISPDLLSSGKQLNITYADVDANRYVTIGDISGWRKNSISETAKASKTIIWYTANNSNVSSETAQGIYPQWSNVSTYPSYYMYYLQGVNRGSYSPTSFTYTFQLYDWPSTASIQVDGDANSSASYNTDGGTVTTSPNRVTASNVTASTYNGYTSKTCVDNSAMTIKAYYTKQYTLQLVDAPSSGVSVTIDHDYNNGAFTSGTYTTTGTVEVTPSFAASDVHVDPVAGYDITTVVNEATSTITVTYALTTYSVTVNNPAGGTIKLWDALSKPLNTSLNKTAGTTIYMLATPADVYVLSSWSVKDADGNAVAVSNNSFTMPASNVTVTASFEADSSLVAEKYVVIQSASVEDIFLKVPAPSTDRNVASPVTTANNQYDPESVMKLVRYVDYGGNQGGFWLNGVTHTDSWVGYPQNGSNNLAVVSTSTHDVKDASGNKTNNGYGWAGNYSISKCGTDANDTAIYQLTDINYNCLNNNRNYLNRTIALTSNNTNLTGSNGSTDVSKWYIHVVTPYTVTITGDASGTVTYNGTDLYGAAETQSTGGTYYFERTPVKTHFMGNTALANKAGKVTVDDVNHTITVEFIDAYSYAMTLVDIPDGSTVAVAGDIDAAATYTESGTVITNNGTLTASDITLTPATNASGFSKRVVIDNSARTIRAGYAQAYTLTFVDAPSGATATIAHDFDGISHNASGTIYLTQTITDADITASAAGYAITKAIDNTAHTITLTYDNGATGITSLSQITNMSGNYFAKPGFTATGTPVGTQADPFTGTFDGRFLTISGTTSALFGYVDGATIKNVTLDNVTISGGTNVGAIANEATGNSRIYNCQVLASGSKDFIANPDNEDKSFTSTSTVSGSGAVGGIVGLMSGNARVINCVSYADVTGGTYGAGIVGHYNGSWINNTGTTVNGDGNMVMNCLMLGDVKSGSTQMSPIVGGNGVTSTISTWDYFRYASMPNVQNMKNNQNGALTIDEDKWLKRYEFFRSCLNNHRNLAAVYCFDDASRMTEMAKWTIDESISPWPILKAHDQNTRKTLDRVIPTTTEDNAGKQLGTLAVTAIINGSSRTVNLPITDMDHAHYDYTWGKVILPFANEFTGWTPETTNTTDYDRIIIGWEITSLTGGTTGTFTDYNFADRDCTAKDVYNSSTNPFIYAQGGMFIVPNGVTAITITAHWANAFYLADEYYDMDISTIPFSETYDASKYINCGGLQRTTYNGKTIYHSLREAQAKMTTDYLCHTQAIVLVGNYHFRDAQKVDTRKPDVSKGFTIMSVDEDADQEPDYGVYNALARDNIYHLELPAARWDFVPTYATGIFQKSAKRAMLFSVPKTKGWWEFTETCLARSYELEAWDVFHASSDNGKGNNAFIINGGYHTQFIRGRSGTYSIDRLSYVKVGGKAFVKEFFQGNHTNDGAKWKLIPTNVTGGEITYCYMTGQSTKNNTGEYVMTTNNSNNVRFYCSGGKIGKFLGCYMEYPVNNVTANIDHAIIDKFYGGGTTQAGHVLGNIVVNIKNSYVEDFCGGPEFGDMEAGKTVTVNADNTTFGTYYGAGYGGTAMTRIKSTTGGGEQGDSQSAAQNIDDYNIYYLQSKTGGIGVYYEVEEFMNARGQYYFRFYDYTADLNLASTGNVISTLNNCKVINNFYGGGCQGKVAGTITSTLTDCNVLGSVFGGGYKAAATEVDVYSRLTTWPKFDNTYGAFDAVQYPTPVKYKWEHKDVVPETPHGTNANGEKVLYTTTDMTQMGVVTGDITLTIENGTVAGNVYGGGNESPSQKNTTVNIIGNASITGDVFGGGNMASVEEETTVNIEGGTVSSAVYGGGALANTGNTNVLLLGGTVNDVFGGGLGRTESGTAGQPGYVEPIAATVGNANVTLGKKTVGGTDQAPTYTYSDGSIVNGSIFGCNNLNGTPLGHAKVTIYHTKARTANATDFHVPAVYGGGNKAAYIPTDRENEFSEVLIEGCDNSIEFVYGGGNAAPVPATKVTIYGADKIGTSFGGGNGKGDGNPGADVGYLDYTRDNEHSYGPGTTNTYIYGGTIDVAYGGSNTLGYIRTSAAVDLDELPVDYRGNICELKLGSVYAGGNEAEMFCPGSVTISCSEGADEIFGGSNKTDMHGDVTLNINSGTFGKVFGGNNTSGNVYGKIVINIDETGCMPIIIGELYGGGYKAPYSVYGYNEDGLKTPKTSGEKIYDDPVINLVSFTKIGKIFGGGLGETATVYGSPVININPIKGVFANTTTSQPKYILNAANERVENTSVYPIADSVGEIGYIYGGGNEASTYGDTNVNIGTKLKNRHVTGSDELQADEHDVSVIITGNIYGGGKGVDQNGKETAAKVYGNTNVNIGVE